MRKLTSRNAVTGTLSRTPRAKRSETLLGTPLGTPLETRISEMRSGRSSPEAWYPGQSLVMSWAAALQDRSVLRKTGTAARTR